MRTDDALPFKKPLFHGVLLDYFTFGKIDDANFQHFALLALASALIRKGKHENMGKIRG